MPLSVKQTNKQTKEYIMKPDFKVAKIDETSNWDKSITDIGKKIYGIYLYDANIQTFCCSATSSYEMHFIESSSKDIPTDDIDRNDFLEEIEKGDIHTESISYIDCNTIDGLSEDDNVDYSDYEPSKDEYDTKPAYEELVSDLISEYKGNPTF
jgi:hypothetical protein